MTRAARRDARWQEAIPVSIAFWLFILIIFLPVLIDRHEGEPWSSIALDGSTVLVSMLLSLPLFALFRVTLHWPTTRRLLTLVGAVALISVGQTIFDLLFTGWVADHLEQSWAALPRNFSRAIGAAFNYICAFLMNVGLFQLFYMRNRTLSQERKLAAAQSAAQQAQLEALRLQLNPHFLFNTLNAISSMIVTKRNDDAEAMTERLCSFLRASLSFDPTELVPLDEELALVEDYLQIEQVRFGERLIVEMDCENEARGVPIPGLLIQPLVENAIKYGVAPSRQPVTLAIAARLAEGDLVITVADDGAADANSFKAPGAGVGLRNIRNRLLALYGPAATLDAAPMARGYGASIRIPTGMVPAASKVPELAG